MIIGMGTDIVEISRIRNAYEKNPGFLNRIFTQYELEYIESKNYNPQNAAGGFAAKEAVSKALGTGISGFSFKDIEIRRNSAGKPMVILHNNALACAKRNGICSISLSISHERNYAIAVAIAENNVVAHDNDIRDELLKDIDKFKNMLLPRISNTHKGTYGKIYVLAGSAGMPGAGVMAAKAALRSGAGSVVLGVPICIQGVVNSMLMEVMTHGLRDEAGHLHKACIDDVIRASNECSCLLIGPGITDSEATKYIVEQVIINSSKTLIIDADGLNAIAGRTHILKQSKNDVIITPHPGEMARLIGCSTAEVQKSREKIALEFSREFNTITVLKGHNTIVAEPDGSIYVNKTGNPGMATAGSGDVLAGIISAFAAQGLKSNQSAMLGVFVHGMAGDKAAEEIGEYGLIAEDIIRYIPHTIKSIVGK